MEGLKPRQRKNCPKMKLEKRNSLLSLPIARVFARSHGGDLTPRRRTSLLTEADEPPAGVEEVEEEGEEEQAEQAEPRREPGECWHTPPWQPSAGVRRDSKDSPMAAVDECAAGAAVVVVAPRPPWLPSTRTAAPCVDSYSRSPRPSETEGSIPARAPREGTGEEGEALPPPPLPPFQLRQRFERQPSPRHISCRGRQEEE